MKKQQFSTGGPDDKKPSKELYEKDNILQNSGRLQKIGVWEHNLSDNTFYCPEESK